MNPLIVVFCASLSAHAALLPAPNPQPRAPVPPIVASPPGPPARAGSDPAFASYFAAESEFLAAEERVNETPEGSPDRASAGAARALAFDLALARLEETARRDDIDYGSWHDFALASARMRRDAVQGSMAFELFDRAEIRAWLAYQANALRRIRMNRTLSDALRWALLFEAPASTDDWGPRRRAAYRAVKGETWDWAYVLLDRQIEELIPDGHWPLEELADEFSRRIHEEDRPYARAFYRNARREVWWILDLLFIEEIISARFTTLMQEEQRLDSLDPQPDEESRAHLERLQLLIRHAVHDQYGLRLEMSGWLRRTREHFREHFHSRHELIENGGPS